ncbi:hypothetical protein APUTEX25_004321, partial [Auxenochlorella protothecoides]
MAAARAPACRSTTPMANSAASRKAGNVGELQSAAGIAGAATSSSEESCAAGGGLDSPALPAKAALKQPAVACLRGVEDVLVSAEDGALRRLPARKTTEGPPHLSTAPSETQAASPCARTASATRPALTRPAAREWRAGAGGAARRGSASASARHSSSVRAGGPAAGPVRAPSRCPVGAATGPRTSRNLATACAVTLSRSRSVVSATASATRHASTAAAVAAQRSGSPRRQCRRRKPG